MKLLLSFVLSLLVLTCLSAITCPSKACKERNLCFLFDLSVFHSDCIAWLVLRLEQIIHCIIHCKFLVRLKTWYGLFHAVSIRRGMHAFTVAFDCMHSLVVFYDNSVAFNLACSACLFVQLLKVAVSN